MSPIYKRTQSASVDEERLTSPVTEMAVSLVTGQEPQADRNLGRVEELSWQRHHAVNQIGLDDAPANLTLARLRRAHRSIGQNESGLARRREMANKMLDPSE